MKVSTTWIALAFLLLALIGVGWVSAQAMVSTLLDSVVALLLLGPAVLGGLWLVPLLGLGKMPHRWHLLLGASLGIGALSLWILLLGMAGLLDRSFWVVILGAAGVAGVLRLRQLGRSHHLVDTQSVSSTGESSSHWRWLLFITLPFLVLGLLAASAAPGFLWAEEGYGYDVLEYHLQVPKEYFQAGKIEYLPHNVYANFPSNVEMHSLLAMIMLDDSADVGTVVHTLHLWLACLTVFAAWVAGREWSPKAGVICAASIGTLGWLPYLSGVAYVEHGLLFFSMTCVATLLKAMSCEQIRDTKRWLITAGVLGGLAAGCKYTGLAMVIAPLAFTVFFLTKRTVMGRLKHTAAFLLPALIATSPWLIKNQIHTGNPIFPLMNSVFHGAPDGWGESQTLHWDRSHRLKPEEQTLGFRLNALWHRVLWDHDHRFGPAIFMVAILGLLTRRLGRCDGLLLLLLIMQVAVWLWMTHLFSRFAIVLTIPLALLCGRAMLNRRSVMVTNSLILLMIAGAGWNLTHQVKRFRAEYPGAVPAELMYGGLLPGREYYQTVNEELPDDARILLIGDAQAFYFQREVDYHVCFNRSPFFELIVQGSDGQSIATWLHQQGYTHLLVNFSELNRIANTYGFTPAVTPQQVAQTLKILTRHGLELSKSYSLPNRDQRYVELYTIKTR